MLVAFKYSPILRRNEGSKESTTRLSTRICLDCVYTCGTINYTSYELGKEGPCVHFVGQSYCVSLRFRWEAPKISQARYTTRVRILFSLSTSTEQMALPTHWVAHFPSPRESWSLIVKGGKCMVRRLAASEKWRWWVGLRKCIRPLVEEDPPGHDGMRCALFLSK